MLNVTEYPPAGTAGMAKLASGLTGSGVWLSDGAVTVVRTSAGLPSATVTVTPPQITGGLGGFELQLTTPEMTPTLNGKVVLVGGPEADPPAARATDSVSLV